MQLAYKKFGEGQDVIILHGLFGAGRNWQGIARALTGNLHVVIPDLRNHGSSPHAMEMGYEVMANDVAELIAELNLANPIIIGHSMGGKVAMTLALNNPELVQGLVIVDIAPVSYEHDFSRLITAMRSLTLTELSSRSEAENKLKTGLGSERLAAFIVQNLARVEGNLSWRINLEDITQCLPEIGQFPMQLAKKKYLHSALFIGGTESRYITEDSYAAIYQHFPEAQVAMLQDAGHWTHVDKPEEFLQLVNEFIHTL